MVTPYVFGDDTARVNACVTAAYTRQSAEGTVKVWEDLARYRKAIEATRPELLIECGTYTGVSAAWFADRTPHVVTVDVIDRVAVGLPDNVTTILGSSVDPGVVDRVARIARRHDRVMVVLDSDHSAAHVAAEIDAYGPLVTPGLYLVVEDAIARWMPGETEHGTPYDAIEELLMGNPAWTNDTRVMDMHPITMFPDGWWKRNAR